MPPVNTPAVTSSPTISPPQSYSPVLERPLTPFSYLSSPAPDLASTLHTQAADAADEANTDFLRDSLEALDHAAQQFPARAYVDAQRDPRLASAAHTTQTQTHAPHSSRQEPADDLSRRERLQRVLARLNRMHEPQAAASDNAYGNRTPSPNRQSLYDWAPGADDANEDSELDAILAELRRQQPETSPEILRLLGQAQAEGQRDSPARAASYMRVNGTVESYEQLSERRRRERQGLRNRALLRARQQESSPSATERMLRYMMDRERSGLSEEEERARGSGWFRPTPRIGLDDFRSRESWLLPHRLEDTQDRDRQERVDAFRRGYLAEHAQVRLPRISTLPGPATSTPSPFLENALKYLSDLRACRGYEDALATAMDNNLATKEFFADKHDDFVLDLNDIGEPAPSSWIQPGTVFEGHQHASGASMNITHHRHAQPGAHIEQINPNYRANENIGSGRTAAAAAAFDPSRSLISHQMPPDARLSSAASPKVSDSDHWPVRVTIHSIDWTNMTLQGTMEAYDVPQHPASTVNILNPGASATGEGPENGTRPKAGKKNAPITTYLEGHIIDHHTHSFLTPTPSHNPKHRRASTTSNNNTNNNNTSNPTPLADTISFPSATPHLDAQNWLALPPSTP
ncbi:hypothetical protein Q7P37_003762 [Cladosporium fusiforme]